MKIMCKGKEVEVKVNWLNKKNYNNKALFVPYIDLSEAKKILDALLGSWDFIIKNVFTNKNPQTGQDEVSVVCSVLWEENQKKRVFDTVGIGKNLLEAQTRAIKRAVKLIAIDIEEKIDPKFFEYDPQGQKILINNMWVSIYDRKLSEKINGTVSITPPSSKPDYMNQNLKDKDFTAPLTIEEDLPEETEISLAEETMENFAQNTNNANQSSPTPQEIEENRRLLNQIQQFIQEGRITLEQVKQIRQECFGENEIRPNSPSEVVREFYYLVESFIL